MPTSQQPRVQTSFGAAKIAGDVLQMNGSRRGYARPASTNSASIFAAQIQPLDILGLAGTRRKRSLGHRSEPRLDGQTVKWRYGSVSRKGTPGRREFGPASAARRQTSIDMLDGHEASLLDRRLAAAGRVKPGAWPG